MRHTVLEFVLGDTGNGNKFSSLVGRATHKSQINNQQHKKVRISSSPKSYLEAAKHLIAGLVFW